ncbi:FAD-dependent monooxygenase [Phytomonospora endophytica]|uniref:2-polyprenyl-6-methoxyphenol hydroxylase-like FAD-dependent oxidoreductase n=1 Tax=Phytomonospora endophytica TaxID=714109 RepID=A0A841F8J5_9ACTN|nr:FAD-dependent monooxygenase [Phytomonospora endophytica]MBB6032546.1 2-polyprenyl-6-methoxyphenol hydroxylase-like FAD-dependent oxidoreductase [Phytomonospora endophytica]GIG66304.1 FAD-dependent oxidoreductase [Phytomonospora endophytica]
MNTDTEVAVVGGGPVGMLLATELARLGVRTLVLERLTEPTGESKAGTLHARTAQTLDRRGLLEAVQPGPGLARTAPGRPVRFHFAGMFDLDLARVVNEGPALVGSPQAYAEEVFAALATRLGARIERGAEVVGLTQESDHVRLDVTGPDGTVRTVTASWVVGTDGARSAVRRLSGIPFTGTPATLSALMGEVRLTDLRDAPQGWVRTPRGWTMVWPNPYGLSRVATYDFRGPHPDRHSPVTIGELSGEMDRITGRPVPMDSPRWLTRFTDAALQAEEYRRGRVLLAGDAAHVHFPAGGQGLNLGLQDAVNLGWKLAAEVHGRAPGDLLGTYHRERHPVAARVLENVRAQVALMNPDPRVDSLRELFRELMHLDDVNVHLGGMISGADIAYDLGEPGDPFAGVFAPDLHLKTADTAVRLAELLRTGRPVLLDLADRPELRELAAAWSGHVDVVHATPEEQVNAEALLVRPDGYLAYSARGGDQEAARLRAALERWFGSPE